MLGRHGQIHHTNLTGVFHQQSSFITSQVADGAKEPAKCMIRLSAPLLNQLSSAFYHVSPDNKQKHLCLGGDHMNINQ